VLRLKALALAALLALSACQDSTQADDTIPVGSGFDFFVLALSWSPSYCEAAGDRANPQQCESGRPFGFIVHGLWPQFEKGYPEFCRARPQPVSRDIMSDLLDIMPSRALVQHQWKKHGTCANLSQSQYFETLRLAREKIVVPDGLRNTGAYRMVSPSDVSKAFIEANPGLQRDGIAVTCDRRRLREVRICLTTGLTFRTCPEVARRSCGRERVTMPPLRGR